MAGYDKIIEMASPDMREMLRSVADYNSLFIKNKKQEKLLEKILFAMSVIDREFFYKGGEVYSDNALPIGEGQTISQPSTVARMLLLSGLAEGDAVLEVGTGSGWNACLIGYLVYPGNVISVERFFSLKKKAFGNFSALKNNLKEKKPEIVEKLEKINFSAENIFDRKKAWKKKYDRIIITAGIERGGERRIEELAEKLLEKGGVLVCPYVSGPLIVFEKKEKLQKLLTEEEYLFVPLL